MYVFEVKPAFRGRTYSDALQMIDPATGAPLLFASTDVLTWRLLPLGPDRFGRGWGWGWGCDYGFGLDANIPLNGAALVVLSLGQGLSIGLDGTAGWVLAPGQTLILRRPEYRMTMDLTRFGVTAPLLDTTLQVMG